ncbi:N-acetylmuramoyl-L-alanine amidase family protein [Winogradskyella marincola]|uniref:N-acetylmuramoyl-L-alanine amidase n=1 Tax=Winogradskyella marincola TaxID=3037795 RepID=A0ABT6G0H6_9FLAO|nr:N-acetylmuramoyl-L-alanine amidase [Winogradskyella sp. YYF002]MDG4715542.1 N-acetylmuramoyl-L-alanine amidase [Winogradskyella sp. YYF002]
MQTKRNNIIVFLVLTFITSLTCFTALQAQEDKFVVVLDAGHGGHDSGNLGNGYKEKNIALNVTLEIGKELEKNNNIKVIYTRKTDVFIELHERANIANRADADLFVSIHCNAHSSQAAGTETFVLGEKNTGRNFEVAKRENEVIFLEDNYEQHYEGFDPSSPESTIAIGIEQEVYVEQSIVLARKIEDNFINNAKRKSRGLKQASLLVIRNTYMPSVLVEVGFLTNNKEGAYLNTKSGQSKMAKAIKDAILSYKAEIDQNVGSSILGTEKLDTETVETLENLPLVYEGITFKVQIAASSKDLETKPYNFKGLSDISKLKVGKLYKYFYGSTSDYNKVKQLQEEAKSKGYTSSFVVAYNKKGEQIELEEALKSATN